MNIIWLDKATKDIKFWEKHNHKIVKRIQCLIDNIEQTPLSGIGKPEALKHELSGLWSRRIDQTHRLIYRYDQQINLIEIISCKGHYS